MTVGDVAESGNPRTDPSTRSADYEAMVPYWNKVDTILGGTEAMRLAGEKYLPRFQEEQPNSKDSRGGSYDPYTLRLAKTPFTNIYEDILRNLSAKPFGREVKLKDAPTEYETLEENIDGMGRSLHVFANEWFRDALNHAISWVLVDYSKPTPRADGFALTKADEAAQNLRPYWCFIPATAVIAVYSDWENQIEIITHARVLEPQITLDGYLEVLVERVRVMDREVIGRDIAGKPNKWGVPTYKLWELIRPPPNSTSPQIWQVVDEGVYTIGVIPLVPFITGERKVGSYIIAPPLKTVADLQIQEYNEESNLQNILDLTGFPMYAGIGVDKPEDPLVVGPRSVVWIPPPAAGPQGDFKAVEPAGMSIKIVFDKLQNTRTEMRDLGMQPLTQSNLTVITTGQVAVKANSQVMAWAIRFADALEQCWQLTADWLGDATFEPEVLVTKDFVAGMNDGVGFTADMQLRTNKDISGEAIVDAAIRYGYLPEDFDYAADQEVVAKEAEDAMANTMVTIDPVTGKPLQQPLATTPPPPKSNGSTQSAQPPPTKQ